MVFPWLLPLAGFVLILALVQPVARLSLHLSQRLNRDWRESALEWAQAAGAGPEPVSALDRLDGPAVADPRPAMLWSTGLAVALLCAAWIWRNPDDPIGGAATLALGLALLLGLLVDLRIQLLPDLVIWPVAGLGALLCLTGHGVSPQTALWGALAGGGGLWLLSALFALLRGQAGLGLGDVKLVAAAGLWLGWMPLPWLLMLATSGAIAMFLVSGRGKRAERMAFGPALALAFLAIRLF